MLRKNIMENGASMGPYRKEQDKPTDYEAKLLSADGLGCGEGSISTKARLADPTDALTPVTMELVHDTIVNGEILVPIDKDKEGQLLTDDGCGDGRGVNRVIRGLEFLKKSFNRAKVFGGGLTMGIASRIGLGQANGSLKDLFETEAEEFRRLGIDYGAHIDENFGDKNSGCGAIDRAPDNIHNALAYKKQITETVGVLSGFVFGEEPDETTLDIVESVFKGYEQYESNFPNEDHAGAEILDVVAEKQKVVKELDSKEGHREVAIVLNLVEDMTVNQELIREVTDNVAQVFGVDVPRLLKIANRRYDNDHDRKAAFISMLVYTLSTAATLTDGSLPVYITQPIKKPEYAVS